MNAWDVLGRVLVVGGLCLLGFVLVACAIGGMPT